MRSLYAIIDADFLEAAALPLLPFAEQVIAGGPRIIQLRAKHASPRTTLGWLRALRPLCSLANVALFANDRPDLAVLAGCDGVHVGQGDLLAADVRRFAPSLKVGVSTHDELELGRAIAQRPDYVAFGPVFPTASKERPEPVVGLAALARASERCAEAGLPLVGIGGIDLERAPLVARHASLVAVIAALLPPDGLIGVARRVRELTACV